MPAPQLVKVTGVVSDQANVWRKKSCTFFRLMIYARISNERSPNCPFEATCKLSLSESPTHRSACSEPGGEIEICICWKRMFKSTHNFVPSAIINNHHSWKRLDLCFWRKQTGEPYCSPHHPTHQRWGWVEIKSLISELIFANFKPEYFLPSL